MSEQQNTIIITGAAGGIGSAFAHHFAQQQANLMLVDLSESSLSDLKERLLAAGNVNEEALQTCVADVTKAGEVQKYVEQTRQAFGGVTGFLNNAGVEGGLAAIPDYPQDVFEHVMAVNVTGVWLGMKYVVPLMKESGGGSIVITSSVGGVMGSPGLSAYVTSKHAVIGIMRTAALECAKDNIRVNTIHPGMVD
ncbi:MAG: SDR family NAD(P)-dependent oxidoreductase, partial [Pseudomonadales bacterium]